MLNDHDLLLQGRKLDPGWSNSSSTVVTSESHLVTTALRSNPIYIKVYINTMYLVVMFTAPFLILAVLNCRIWLEIRKAKENRNEIAASHNRLT